MTDATMIAQKATFQAGLAVGRTQFCCARGRSAHPPFCDGTHKRL